MFWLGGIRTSIQKNTIDAVLAQLVEHLTCNEDVVGSIPTDGSSFRFFKKSLDIPKEICMMGGIMIQKQNQN